MSLDDRQMLYLLYGALSAAARKTARHDPSVVVLEARCVSQLAKGLEAHLYPNS